MRKTIYVLKKKSSIVIFVKIPSVYNKCLYIFLFCFFFSVLLFSRSLFPPSVSSKTHLFSLIFLFNISEILFTFPLFTSFPHPLIFIPSSLTRFMINRWVFNKWFYGIWVINYGSSLTRPSPNPSTTPIMKTQLKSSSTASFSMSWSGEKEPILQNFDQFIDIHIPPLSPNPSQPPPLFQIHYGFNFQATTTTIYNCYTFDNVF